MKETCSQKIKRGQSKRDAVSLIAGGTVVNGRKYPWAGGFFYNDDFQCGGNLSKLLKTMIISEPFNYFLQFQ